MRYTFPRPRGPEAQTHKTRDIRDASPQDPRHPKRRKYANATPHHSATLRPYPPGSASPTWSSRGHQPAPGPGARWPRRLQRTTRRPCARLRRPRRPRPSARRRRRPGRRSGLRSRRPLRLQLSYPHVFCSIISLGSTWGQQWVNSGSTIGQ